MSVLQNVPSQVCDDLPETRLVPNDDPILPGLLLQPPLDDILWLAHRFVQCTPRHLESCSLANVPARLHSERTSSMLVSRSVMNSKRRASVAKRRGTNKERITWWNLYGFNTDSNRPLSIRLLRVA